ncbi:MAG: thiolase family protein [Candidatus Margulisiibacteriota bacterium]
MRNRIAIIDGVRTPFCKAGVELKNISADDLGAYAVKEVLMRSSLEPGQIDELVFGNVAQPANAANVARVIALKAGLAKEMPAVTVHRNCASGMEAVTTAANKILAGEADILIAGGTESMSNIPLLFNRDMTALFARLMRAKTPFQKMMALLSFRPSFLSPIIGIQEGLTDPISGLNMGATAEVLAREFQLSRLEQDEFALASHLKAVRAMEKGIFAEEIVPVPIPPDFKAVQRHDGGPRAEQTLAALQKLKPYFDRKNGTVTVGNACPVSDGAAALIVMSEAKAKELGLTPLGYLREYAYAGLDPHRMGLGPVYATAKLLAKTHLMMKDFELIELNEAFAAQALACERAFASDEFAKTYLGLSKAVGALDMNIVNVNGGAIALGHPVGATGARLILTLLRELRRRGLQTGLATLCIGGGQGAALALEVN